MSTNHQQEKKRQDAYTWRRTSTDAGHFATYNQVLGAFQAESIREHARGERLLDLACGDGSVTHTLAHGFRRVVGVDASDAHIEAARAAYPDMEFHVALIEDFETEERFDTIVLLNVLEHVRDPQVVLQHVQTLLAPGGRILVHVPNANAINRRIAVLMGTLVSCDELSPYDIDIAGHRRSYTMESLVREAEDAGLVVQERGGVFYKMLSSAQMDWFLREGLWETGGFGWGRVGAEHEKDWRQAFCRACYEIGKERPTDCNTIYICAEAAHG